MRIKEKEFTGLNIEYPIDKIADKERLLFLDIETTGFTSRSSQLYMVGCAYYQNERFHLIQWFADDASDEKQVVKAFLDFSANYTHMVHFNGNNFDIPYLVQKALQYDYIFHVESMDGLDLYRRIASLKNFLKLPNCKQKTIEEFLGIERIDKYPGGELIEVYHNYTKSPSDSAYEILSQHNADDVEGMLKILPILSYSDLFHEEIKVTKAIGNYYHDLNGKQCQEVLLTLELPSSLPVKISYGVDNCYFTGAGTQGTLRVPMLDEELKYFYANYRDYYYLPNEDIALHKSVASFVEKNQRISATAETCYTRKRSLFLPEWTPIIKPIFKSNYHSREIYFELTDELKRDRQIFCQYASHVLEHMVQYKA